MSTLDNLAENAASVASRFINNTGRHVFLTGKAGTGKTTFLRSIVQQTHKSAIVAAPTGIAAINAGGITLHSLFQLPFGSFIPSGDLPVTGNFGVQMNNSDSLLRNLQMHATKRKLIREMELLIIDEVSMLRADLLDAIDVTLRAVRRNRHQPFGGVQVLFIGDLFQLPPVVKQEEWEYLRRYYNDLYFFSAKALENHQPVYIELEKIYRQSDDTFISILNHYRENRISREDVEMLNKRYIPDFQPGRSDGYIFLTTHNRKADSINRDALAGLPGKLFTYSASVEKDFNEYLYPVEASLELKEGAQVMFIKNDYSGERRYFNGRIGTVTSLSDEEIRVGFTDGGDDIPVDRYIWENKKYSLAEGTNEIEEHVAGTFAHFPLKLAWAITVHKSQGLTFEKAIIDVSSAFAPGQIYVALSRLVSLDGLVLSAPVPQSGPPQEEALKQFVINKAVDPPLQEVLPLEIRTFIRDSVLKAFNFGHMVGVLNYFTDSHDKDETRSAKQKQKGWAVQIARDFLPVRETADKFIDQLKSILRHPNENYLPVLGTRLEAAKGYFEPILSGFSNRVRQQVALMDGEKGAKAYLTELHDLERQFFRQRQMIYKAEELVKSAIRDREFSKDALLASDLYMEAGTVKSAGNVKKEKKEKEKKQKKERSDLTSYNMFREGKSIRKIAFDRSMNYGTVEGHLLPYVAKGLIEITELVDRKKVDRVHELINELDTLALAPLKERLGEDVSYGELRFVVAAKRFGDEQPGQKNKTGDVRRET